MCVCVCNCCGMDAVNYWSKPLNHGQGPLWLRNGRQRKRATEGRKIVFAIWGPGLGEGKAGKETEGAAAAWKGPIGGQSLRVWGSIWKATLCRALYCTPCCFNQWQACSQSLEQPRLFFIVSLLPPFFLLHYILTFLSKPPKSRPPLPSLGRRRQKRRAAAIKRH